MRSAPVAQAGAAGAASETRDPVSGKVLPPESTGTRASASSAGGPASSGSSTADEWRRTAAPARRPSTTSPVPTAATRYAVMSRLLKHERGRAHSSAQGRETRGRVALQDTTLGGSLTPQPAVAGSGKPPSWAVEIDGTASAEGADWRKTPCARFAFRAPFW